MDEQLYDTLNSYKEAIDLCLNKVDELLQRINSTDERLSGLEATIYNEILEPARLAMDGAAKEERFNDFNDKYGERLGAYDKIVGAAEGNPDFSMTRDAFENYDNLPEPKPDADMFIEELVKSVDSQIDSIKESLGIEPEAKVEVTQDENGDTEIKADGEVVAEEKDGEVVTTEATEEGTGAATEESAKDEEQGEFNFDDDDEEKEDDPDEVKEYEAELEKQFR